MISIGLLGCGRIGQVHALSLSRIPSAHLTAVADAVPEAAQALAKTSGAEVRGAEEIITATDIDAVIVATPTTLHYEQIHALADAGKAIFCEKPIDLSSDRAAECRAAVKAAGVGFFTAFNRRFDPNFAHLQAQLAAGVIGAPEIVVITSRDPSPPPISYIEQSGGLFRDMMIHDFDMANFIMGQAPVSVSAVGSSIVDPAIGAAGDVDTAAVTLTYADGRIAVIKNSRRAVYGYDQRVEVLGSDGLLQAQNVLENTVVKSTTAGVSSAKPTYFFLERYMPAYKAEWTAFVEAVQGKSDMPVNLHDGVAALAMAEAATRSAQTGQPVALADLIEISGRGEAA